MPEEQKEVFYTEGPPLLRKLRLAIAEFSLPRAAERIDRLKRLRSADPEGKEEAAETEKCRRKVAEMRNEFSEIADSRPLSACAFNTEGDKLATASWSGNARLWKITLDAAQDGDGDVDVSGKDSKPIESVNMTSLVTFRSHMDRLTDVQWHPDSSLYDGNGAVLTAGALALRLRGCASFGIGLSSDGLWSTGKLSFFLSLSLSFCAHI